MQKIKKILKHAAHILRGQFPTTTVRSIFRAQNRQTRCTRRGDKRKIGINPFYLFFIIHEKLKHPKCKLWKRSKRVIKKQNKKEILTRFFVR